jgi:hypothetical protein
MAGQRVSIRPAQAVVQAQGFRLAVDRQLALLQGVDQFDARRIGLRPRFPAVWPAARVGGDEVFGVAGVVPLAATVAMVRTSGKGQWA